MYDLTSYLNDPRIAAALIAAAVSTTVAAASVFVQIKNTNKSIKAAAENLERTLKHQQEIDENKRQHDTLLKNQDILLSKFEEFFSHLKDLEVYLLGLSDQLVGPESSPEKANRGFPRYKKLDNLNALATIYFSDKIYLNLVIFVTTYDEFLFDQFPKIYSKFNSILMDKRHLSEGDSSQLKYYHQYKIHEIVDMVYDYFYEKHKDELSLEEIIKISPPWIILHEKLLTLFHSIVDSATDELEQLPIKKQYKLGYRVTHPDEQ